MLCLSGFELYSRLVPLLRVVKDLSAVEKGRATSMVEPSSFPARTAAYKLRGNLRGDNYSGP